MYNIDIAQKGVTENAVLRLMFHDCVRYTGGLEGYPNVPEDFTITEKALARAFSWLKAPTSALTFKTLLRHYAKQALTPRSLNVKLGPRRNYHKGRAAIRLC